jgi:hypothetical protein
MARSDSTDAPAAGRIERTPRGAYRVPCLTPFGSEDAIEAIESLRGASDVLSSWSERRCCGRHIDLSTSTVSASHEGSSLQNTSMDLP